MNCNCTCYPFPHRPLGGRCQGNELWQRIFNDGSACDECHYFHAFTELHPYGETSAAEHLRECNVERCDGCPVVQAAASGQEVAA